MHYYYSRKYFCDPSIVTQKQICTDCIMSKITDKMFLLLFWVCFLFLFFLSSLYHLLHIFIFYFSECCTSVRYTNVTAQNTISTSYPAVTSLRNCQSLCDTEKLSGEDCVYATWQTDTAVCDVSTPRCFTGESEN